MAPMGEFDEGYGADPFRALCKGFPDETVYPADAFRVEWGPIFHRGRLDGSARVLVIGQDPATHESIARRILVGEAGQRLQGFLAKIGYTKSYVCINTFLYSVFGQGGGEAHKGDAGIVAYRHQWLAALLGPASKIEVVVTLGRLAREAWQTWIATPAGAASPPSVAITHPTKPESASGGDPVKHKEEIKKMLENWNAGIDQLKPHVAHPDAAGTFAHYGDAFVAGDLRTIPEADLPAGTPAWMRDLEAWAKREGQDAQEKRRTIVVRVPKGAMP